MHIEHEVKLDFKDVLFGAKRSTLTSRADVDVEREVRFRHARAQYQGIPIIAANMDTTGTIEMAVALERLGLSVALHKHYEVARSVEFFRALKRKSAALLSVGITAADEEKFHRVLDAAEGAIEYACI